MQIKKGDIVYVIAGKDAWKPLSNVLKPEIGYLVFLVLHVSS